MSISVSKLHWENRILFLVFLSPFTNKENVGKEAGILKAAYLKPASLWFADGLQVLTKTHVILLEISAE